MTDHLSSSEVKVLLDDLSIAPDLAGLLERLLVVTVALEETGGSNRKPASGTPSLHRPLDSRLVRLPDVLSAGHNIGFPAII
jgi:hypothetical protein